MEQITRDLPNRFSLPRRISRLGQLAYNLWWVWNPEAQMLFAQINKPLWDSLNHNPVAFLQKVERPLLNAVTNDRYYLEFYDRVIKNFDAYLTAQDTWYATTFPKMGDKQVAVAVVIEDAGGEAYGFAGTSSDLPVRVGKQIMEAVLNQ